MIKLIMIVASVLLLPIEARSSTTITAQVVRNQTGSGETFISSGFPFPSGLVTETLIAEGKIKVFIG